MSVLELVERQIAEVVQPLRDQRAQLDVEIERAEAALADLRQARRQLQAVLKTIDPEAPKPKSKTRSNMPSAAKLADLTIWLQEHSKELNSGEGFYASGLDRDYNGSLPIKGNSSISTALGWLHEQGVIRLVRTGTGGSKFYEVVT